MTLRDRAVRACYLLAALEDDPGAAGYCEGMAQRLAETRESVSVAYVERVEAEVGRLLPEVAGVRVDRSTVRVHRSDRWGSVIRLPDADAAADVGAALAGARL